MRNLIKKSGWYKFLKGHATRKDILRPMFLITLTIAITLFALAKIFPGGTPAKAVETSTGKPNILWILTDEQRTDSIGAYGEGQPVNTPNIDALAERGTMFTNCFVQSPVCTPSRVCYLTGMYPHQTGVVGNIQSGADRWPEGLTTFPEVFAEAGYMTGTIGKHHIPAGKRPFQTNNNFIHMDDVTWYSLGEGYKDEDYNVIRAGLLIIGGIYPETQSGTDPTKHATDLAIDWIDEYSDKDEPFLLRVSYNAPHTPVLVPRDYYGAIDPNDIKFDKPTDEILNSRPKYESVFWQYQSMTDEQVLRAHANYFELVSYVDYQIGRIINELERLGELDNTIIVLSSDHGTCIGEYGQIQKSKFYDLTSKVPFIFAGPGIPKGKVVDDLVEQIDLAPTLMDLAGVEIPEQFKGQALFGKNYVPKDHVIGEVVGDGARRSWIRTKKWSLDFTTEYYNVPARTKEERDGKLVDLENDPLYHKNLYYDPAYADIVDELTALLEQRLSEDSVPMAIPKITPTPEPTPKPQKPDRPKPPINTPKPTAAPITKPTTEPTAEPTADPTAGPAAEPTVKPSAAPTEQPTVEPTEQPAPAADPAASETPQKPGGSPKTGDNGIMSFATALLLAGTGLITAIKKLAGIKQ